MHARARRLAVVSIILLALTAAEARAQGGPFGLGLIIGSPTGLSGKLYLDRRNAIDFALGAAFLSSRGLHAHVDYLWHPVMLTEDAAFFMPLYFGVGARLLDHDHGADDDDVHLGARVPVGILFDFRTVPLDVFLEIALIVDLVTDHDDHIDLNAALGARYYF
jgi:hypothetical protein